MKETYFVSAEFHDAESTAQLLPNAEKYGFDSVITISEIFSNDIEPIKIAEELSAKIEGFEIEDKFNIKFYPHLDDQFVFGNSEVLSDLDAIENEFFVKRVNFIKDQIRSAQISVAKKPDDSKSFLSEMMDEGSYFSQNTVSKNFILN